MQVQIRAVSFDFWNTLFMESPGGFRFYKERRHQLLAEALRGHGDLDDHAIDRAFHEESASHHHIWTGQRRTLSAAARFDRILDILGVSLDPQMRGELIRHFEEGILERPPVLVPGAAEVVRELGRQHKLAIISDVGFSPGRVLRQLLAGTGLGDLFGSMVFSDEAGCSKPDRVVFDRTAAALAVRPEEVVHIGDLEFTDVVGAKGAGCYSIRFTGVTPMAEGETTIADRVSASLEEVSDLIHSMGAGKGDE